MNNLNHREATDHIMNFLKKNFKGEGNVISRSIT